MVRSDAIHVLRRGSDAAKDIAAADYDAHLDTGGDCGNVVVAGGSVWLAANDQPYVLRISPQ